MTLAAFAQKIPIGLKDAILYTKLKRAMSLKFLFASLRYNIHLSIHLAIGDFRSRDR